MSQKTPPSPNRVSEDQDASRTSIVSGKSAMCNWQNQCSSSACFSAWGFTLSTVRRLY